jgi:3-methylfumaryl-CoA hydratase
MNVNFEDWIGRSVLRHDQVTRRLLEEFRVTLSPHLFQPDAKIAPPGLHFGLAPAILSVAELGEDGAEARGSFMPPLSFDHRMWAGGSIETLAPLGEGMRITRRSTITDIKHRAGRSGAFFVVSLLHEIEGDGMLAVRERQDLIYRETIRASETMRGEDVPADVRWRVTADPLMLFRFSAFTFNGHRIHYDAGYATAGEGHGGLLVHGPLQAALLLNQLATLKARVPRMMTYRCLAPLFAPQTFEVQSRAADSAAVGRIVSHSGIVTCEASAV